MILLASLRLCVEAHRRLNRHQYPRKRTSDDAAFRTSILPGPAPLQKLAREAPCDRARTLARGLQEITGRQTITYQEALDEALCFGWIDSIQRTIDPQSYAIRFTPRKPGSLWSAYNQKWVAVLKQEKRMAASGLAAFRARDAKADAQQAYERATGELGKGMEKIFRKNRMRRLGILIKDAASGRRLAQMTKKP